MTDFLILVLWMARDRLLACLIVLLFEFIVAVIDRVVHRVLVLLCFACRGGASFVFFG